MRCFLAIELPDQVRQHLTRIQETLRGLLRNVSYTRPENLHITLKFLGNVDDRQLPALLESLQLVKISGQIQLSAARLECFPPRGQVRVVAAAMAGSEAAIAAIHAAIEQRCRMLGLAAENRKYRPHVTLARSRSGLAREQVALIEHAVEGAWPGPVVDVIEFVLFESHLHPEGSRYVKLASFSLRE